MVSISASECGVRDSATTTSASPAARAPRTRPWSPRTSGMSSANHSMPCGIVVAAVEDDEVLLAARQVHIAVGEVAEVAGPQPAAAERLREPRGRRSSRGHAGAAHPELTYLPVAETLAVVVEGGDLVAGERAAAADELDRLVGLAAGEAAGPPRAWPSRRGRVRRYRSRAARRDREADRERRLGHAVAREQCLGLEAARRELLDERAHRPGLDRLGAAAERAHARQVPASTSARGLARLAASA